MHTEPVQSTPVIEAPAPTVAAKRSLFVDLSEEELAEATALAAKYTASGLACDGEEVLLASNISQFADAMLAQNDKMATPAVRAMFNGETPTSQATMITLAQFIRRLVEQQHTDVNELAMDLTGTMLAVFAAKPS
jgi:hypothetical protein